MKNLLVTMLLAAISTTGYAQEWIDVTDGFITNPRYDNNLYHGWMGTELDHYNPHENAEFWNYYYFYTYQDLSGLPAGKYRLSLDAFFRMGNSENDYQLWAAGKDTYEPHRIAFLYAYSTLSSYTKPLALFSEGARTEPLGGDNLNIGASLKLGQDLWVPNNMDAAHYWFEAGYYKNTIECDVDEDGFLRIGFYKDGKEYEGDWVCLDNWKLEYWGTMIQVSSIQLSTNSQDLLPTETFYLTAEVIPNNATYRNVIWSSTDEKVATVDSKGQVKAIGAGTCDIIATARDGSNVEGRCKVTVSIPPVTSDNIIINEIMAANVDVYLDPSFNYGSWVELYNPSDKSVSLGGLYVSDDPKNLKKNRLVDNYGVLPAHGFAILNYDHHEVWTERSYRQIDDKLNCDGGDIIISDGENIIAQEHYEQAYSRISYARTTDGGEEWGLSGSPTPGASNKDGNFAEYQLEAPIVDKDPQLFTGTMQVSVNIPEGATLKYTTDGTAPTEKKGYISETGIFNLESTTCFRFRLFKNGYLPSTVVTRSYILDNENEPFPIISVVTDINNLSSDDYGVFLRGIGNGRPGNGQDSPCNWNMDWDRPVAIDYITTDNKCLISQECDLSMCGGWTRASTPHSFKLKAKKTYDSNNFFKAQLFDKKPYIKSKTLQIRNGGNDNGNRILDPAVQQIVARSGLYVDYQEWQPVHVYINGSHYAVLNLREPNNKDFAESNYGIDTDDMDQFEINPDSNYVQMRGTDEAYLELIRLSEGASDEIIYEKIKNLLDIDEYINYMAVELYTGNWDWPQNNVKGFRDTHDGKFHFVLFDLDGALNTNTPFETFYGKETDYELPLYTTLHGYDYSKGVSIEGRKFYANITFVTLFKNLLQNEKFRKKFIDTFCIMGGSVFLPEKVDAIVDEMAEYLASGNYIYPWSTANQLKNGFRERNNIMITHLQSTGNLQLSAITKQQVKLSANIESAKIMLNDIEVPYGQFDGYLFAPITLKAQAPAGYIFKGWQSTGSPKTSNVFTNNNTWKYYDNGSLDQQSWANPSYDDTAWKSGKARIGYDYNNWHTGMNTETAGNLPTYYFRKSFNLDNEPSETDEFILDFIIDDGMILYVNGIEAGRYNMPDGDVSYDTYASTYAHDNPDMGRMTLNSMFFKKGENVISVEVHNNDNTSSDILWDASLTMIEQNNTQEIVSEEDEYTLPSSESQNLVAIFDKISDDDMLAEDITPVRINEVSAANSIYVNDYFKKNDWIELYNTTDGNIDIKGMEIIHVTDKSKQPKRHEFQVPSDDVTLNTIIPAHGYKVIWCDKLDIIGADIHTDFKLETKGGDVIIITENYKDTLTYEQHLGTQTYGRYPDGSNDVYVMNIPTIAKTNKLSSYDTYYVKPIEPTPEPDAIQSYTKEGGITIAYVDGAVNIKSEDAAIKTADIYNMSGLKMETNSFTHGNNKFISISVAELPRGIYLVHATTEDGDECRIKFIIK